MTSLSPFDALRALLPGLGRDIGPGMQLPGLDADGNTPETEGDRRGPHGYWRASDTPHSPPHVHLRGDGAGPPSQHGGVGQLADTLADAWRQNPSHPLFRELQQLPPETLRQLIQLTSQQHGSETLAAQAEPLARLLTQLSTDARNAAQHSANGDARAMAQALVQQAAQDRAAASGRETPPAFAGRAEDVRGTMAAADSHAASDASQRPVLSTLAALLARGDGLPAHAHGTTLPPPGSGTSPANGQDLAAQQQLQARLAGDVMSAGHADGMAAGSADPTSSGGLLGLVGAAGVTLAAVGNPAGTTHVVAPQAQSRLRQAEDARNDARKRVSEDEMEDEDGGGDRGRDSRDGTSRERGRASNDDRAGGEASTGRDFRAPTRAASANGAGVQPEDAGANTASGSGPATGTGANEARAPAEASSATAAGHTAAIGLLLPRYHGSDDDADEDAQLQGHAGEASLAEEDAEVRHARHLRWGYWALIAVAYGCFGLALATLAPAWFDLPIAQENRTLWRHGLTAVGLASALWAWVLSRRIR